MYKNLKIEHITIILLISVMLHLCYPYAHYALLFYIGLLFCITRYCNISYSKLFTLLIIAISGYFWAWFNIYTYKSVANNLNYTKFAQHEIIIQKVMHKEDGINVVIKILDDKQQPLLKGAWPDAMPMPISGQKYLLYIKAKQPHSYFNPGSFDIEKYMFVNGWHAFFYIVPNKPYTFIELKYNLNTYFDLFRSSIIEQLRNYDLTFAGFFASIGLGQATINEQHKQVLQSLGLSHILAVSGLHISIIAALLYKVLKFYTKSYKLSLIVTLIAAYLFSVLVGLSLATQRAVLMFAFLIFSKLYKRYQPNRSILATACFIMILFNPLCYLSISFWLSFIGVILIWVLFYWHKHLSIWKFNLYFAILLSPINLWFFATSPLIAPISNFVFLPLFAYLILPGVLIGLLLAAFSTTISWFLLKCLDQILHFLWPVLEQMSKIAVLDFHVYGWNIIIWLLFVIASIICVLPINRRYKLYALPCAVLILYPVQRSVTDGSFELVQLDVGQGGAAVIKTKQHTIMFDTGPRVKSFDAGKNIIKPYLDYIRVRKLDHIIVSHNDLDHIGGLDSILETVTTKKLTVSSFERVRKTIMQYNINTDICNKGDSWYLDNVKFEFLHPDQKALSKKRNEQSCVLMITSMHGHKAILTGDIGKKSERQIVDSYGSYLHSAILIAPHHGSKNSSSLLFASNVLPKHTIFSAGYRNMYGHPKPEIVARYANLSSKTYITAQHGAVNVFFNQKNELIVTEYRGIVRNFWNS